MENMALSSTIVESNLSRKLNQNESKSCNKSIDESNKIKCDGCKASYDMMDVNTGNGVPNSDLIHLCDYCSNNNQLCTEKKQQKSPMRSLIPKPSREIIIKSLRSRNITINGDIDVKTHLKGISISKSKSSVLLSDESSISVKKKIEQLEAQLSAIEKKPCKCSEVFNAKINMIEHTIKKNHEYIETEFKRFEHRFGDNVMNDGLSNYHSHLESINDSLSNSIDINDKIADIERTIKEDRLLMEQLFVNQMNAIQKMDENQKSIEIRDQTIKSCEALIELNATNDTFVQNQFNGIKNKIRKIERSMNLHTKIMHQLSGIAKRHNNTIITHLDLNEAYCNDIAMATGQLFNALNERSEIHDDINAHIQNKHSTDPLLEDGAWLNDGINAHTQNKHSTTPLLDGGTRLNDVITHTSQKQISDQHTNGTCTDNIHHGGNGKYTHNDHFIRIRPLRVNGHSDYSRLLIHTHTVNKNITMTEIRRCVGQALLECSGDFSTHSFVVTKLKYGKLNECSLVLILHKPLHVNEFKRFLFRNWPLLAGN